jgi:hypothetical protein
MSDMLDILGLFQAKGGLLMCFVWVVFEVRLLRRDFNRHEHDGQGRAFIKVLE